MVTAWKSPEELLLDPRVQHAFQKLGPYISKGEKVPPEVIAELRRDGMVFDPRKYDPSQRQMTLSLSGATVLGQSTARALQPGDAPEIQPRGRDGILGLPVVAGGERVPAKQIHLVFGQTKPDKPPVLLTVMAGDYAPPPLPHDLMVKVFGKNPKEISRIVAEEHQKYSKYWKLHELQEAAHFWAKHTLIEPKVKAAGETPVAKLERSLAPITVAGLPLKPLPPEREAQLIKEKFEISPYHTFVFPAKSPSELLARPDIAEALKILDGVTRGLEEPSNDQRARSPNGVLEIPIPQQVAERLQQKGVTAIIKYDKEGYKVEVHLVKPGEVLGYDGLIQNADARWDRPVHWSASGLTGAPTSPGSPKPTNKLTIMLAVQKGPGGKELALRDVYAGEKSESGPPKEISELMYGKLEAPANDNGKRQKLLRAKEEALKRKLDDDFTDDPQEREKLGLKPRQGPAPDYTKYWDRKEIEDCVKFWSTHSLADGSGIDPRGKLPEGVLKGPNGQPRPVLARELQAALAEGSRPEAKPFIGEDGIRHIMKAELVPVEIERDGKKETTVELQGGHSPDILRQMLLYGSQEIQGPGNGKYRIARAGDYTIDGKAKAKLADGKTNLKGLLPTNPHGTFTIELEMFDSATGRWHKKKSPTTFFPEAWTQAHIDAAARALAKMPPDQVTGDGKRSYFGLFPSDPAKPDSPPITAWLIMKGDEVVTFFPTGAKQAPKLRD